MTFFTYAHYTKDDNRLFYIGKGSGKRHLKSENRNRHWHRIVAKHGGFEAVILAVWETEQEALDHEEFLIDTFRTQGARLANITSGGKSNSGPRHTPESRKVLSEKLKGRKRTPEQIEQLRLYLKGVPKSEEHRKNLSEARKGMKVPCIWKPIRCITTDTTYPSLSAAAEATGADPSHIVKCCRGKLKKTKGMEFSYVA
jgi:hypothetical protein